MAVELRKSGLEDPFAESSVLSLLPRTLGFAPGVDANATETQDLDAIGGFFKTMTIKGSAELLEQAKVIHRSHPDILSIYPEHGGSDVTSNGKNRPQGRRPALGRKRAKFSLKPESSHPMPNTDVHAIIDRIEDPEEYFLAFEKLENVDKELRKLRGEVCPDPMQQNQSLAARKRRPGLLGKTASYKHHFPAHADTVEGLTVSQKDIIDSRISSPDSATLQPQIINQTSTLKAKESDADGLLDASEKEGSIADKKNKVGNLLEDLLSSFKDLNGDAEATYLREKLQVKSIDVGKIRLPEMITSQKDDSRVANNSVMRKKAEGSSQSQISRVLGRSPLAAMLSLQKRIRAKDSLTCLYSMDFSDDAQGASESLQSAMIKPSVSPVNVDDRDRSCSPADFASPVVSTDGKSIDVEGVLLSPTSETDLISGTETASEAPLKELPSCLPSRDPDCSPKRIDADCVLPIRFDTCLDEENDNMQQDPSVSEQVVSGQEVLPSVNMNQDRTNDMATSLGINVDDNSCEVHESSNCEVEEMVQGVAPCENVCHKDNSDAIKETVPLNERSENSEMRTADNQEHQENSQMNIGTRQKEIARRRNKKDYSRRQSLAGAGTKWECGVRRSTRIRHRPLRDWCGERLLYGRIHDSLATVIGVKYASPGDQGLKVKSYVSEKYADLVARAALY